MIEGTHEGHSELFELAIDAFFQISEADVELDVAEAHLVGDFYWVQICNFPSLSLIHLFILSDHTIYYLHESGPQKRPQQTHLQDPARLARSD